jgi:Zn-dependent peptidase ImmA (M78 family)
MPAEFLSKDVTPLIGKDVLIAIRKLARKYGVSEQAMSIRLSVLGHVELGT